MTIRRSSPWFRVAACGAMALLAGATPAQEPATAPPAAAVEQSVEAATADPSSPATEPSSPATEPSSSAAEPTPPAAERPDEAAPAGEAPAAAPAEPKSAETEPADEATDGEATDDEAAADAAPDEDATDDDEATEEEADEEAPAATDWGGVAERAPAFFGVLHPAVVHLPIALWLVGAVWLFVGLVVPSWSYQVPVVCLWLGMITSIPSVLTGWWFADENGYEGWREWDWESVTVQHRWLGVALVLASMVLCVLSIVAARKQSRVWGFAWRAGLIALALGVAFEGHLGGELVHGEGFLEEAFEAWVNPEE
ncbi:MAG: DUF2231 domain-containing protein [Lacipirellulaceae bacterium]